MDLEDFKGNTKYAIYDSFKILDSSQRYMHMLEVSGYKKYYGTAGDSLKYYSGMKFTTADKDNDEQANHNCAHRYYRGGWWYKNCLESNLSGPLYWVYEGKEPGVTWMKWFQNKERGLAYSFKTTEMKLLTWSVCVPMALYLAAKLTMLSSIDIQSSYSDQFSL